jgi:hypothetical protein
LVESPDFFYDPATKQLRKRFARYPASLDRVVHFFDDYLAAAKDLLSQIKAERQRH